MILSLIIVSSILVALANCSAPPLGQPPASKAQPTTVVKQVSQTIPATLCSPTDEPMSGDDDGEEDSDTNGTGVNYWDNSLYHETDDVDLSALGDISQNNVFGRLCRICPLYILRCPCPPFFRCVLVPRTCTRCAYYRCIPRIPIPFPTLIPTLIPTIPIPLPWIDNEQ